jgi:hypothetical protein
VWEKDVPVPQWEYIFESIPQLQRDVHKLQKLWQIQSSVGMTSLLSLSQELWHTSDATEAKRVHRSHGGVKIEPKEVFLLTAEGRAGEWGEVPEGSEGGDGPRGQDRLHSCQRELWS